MRFLFIILLSPMLAAAQKKDTANYFLVGKLEMFQLLYKAVSDPDNVTRKQVSDLAHWLVQAKMIAIDTTKKEKPKK